MPDVQLTIGATAFGGWKTLRVTRSIEQISGEYEIGVSDTAPDSSQASAIAPGARASLSLNGHTIISGYVDDVEISHSVTEHAITVRGRDAAGDLVDCAAVYKSGQWTEQTMLSIARDLLEPFGIPVRAEVDVGKAFATWNVEPGETVFENLDRMARHRGVLLVSDGVGGLVITRAGKTVVGSRLELGENILSGRITHSHAERFSEYSVVGQRPSVEDTEVDDTSQLKGRAEDAAVTRYRPMVEVVEDVGDTDTLKRRAEWRRNVNAGRALRSTTTVQGWGPNDTSVWQPNQLVVVNDARQRLNWKQLLIVGVTHTLDMHGTFTELSLAPRTAFAPEELPEKTEEVL